MVNLLYIIPPDFARGRRKFHEKLFFHGGKRAGAACDFAGFTPPFPHKSRHNFLLCGRLVFRLLQKDICRKQAKFGLFCAQCTNPIFARAKRYGTRKSRILFPSVRKSMWKSLVFRVNEPLFHRGKPEKRRKSHPPNTKRYIRHMPYIWRLGENVPCKKERDRSAAFFVRPTCRCVRNGGGKRADLPGVVRERTASSASPPQYMPAARRLCSRREKT